jgi:N utilization substance protein B
MRIAIAGSSGLIGSALVDHLRSQGHEVLRLVRRPSKSSSEITWDPANGDIDLFSLNGVEVFINLAGAGVGDRRWTTKYKKEILNRKISWQEDFDLVRKLFLELRATDLYKNYMSSSTPSLKEDKQFLISVATEFLYEHELVNHIFEEKNIHWADDTFGAFSMISRTFENFNGEFKLTPLFKDAEDDKKFISTLFLKTIAGDKDYEKLIDDKTKNWELDRIASMDVLLMKMAITEFLHISNVPVKVSLNEYIDISKEYSTPNSKTFINGILDKIIVDLKRDNLIQKTGRGLMEGN